MTFTFHLDLDNFKMNRVDPMISRNSLDMHRETYTAVQDSYRKLCDFPNFSRKILVIFKTFQGNFYLHIHHRNSLKVSFMTKFRCRVGSISSFPISIRYRILDHKLSAINNDARMWADAGVPQTPEPISAVSAPKFAIL